MKYLIYMSTSVRLFNDAELKQILQTSHANNLVNNITGMLLYGDGTFVQVLEGEPESINRTYEKIKKDLRHKNIILLVEDDLQERIFPRWSMGFKTLSPSQFSVFDAFINPKHIDSQANDDKHPAISILKTFAEANNL